MPPEIRILIVDDHPVVRQGLRAFLGAQPDLDVVGEAADGESAAEEAARLTPDVVLLDLAMPGIGGLAALPRIRDASPVSRVLILTSSTTDEAVLPAMRSGASGFLVKDAAPADLAQAVRTVAAGGSYLGPTAAQRVLDELADHAIAARDTTGAGPGAGAAVLTPRERDVLVLVAEGLANKTIARRLGVSEKTVKTHVSSIFLKIGVSDRTQAALWAVRHGVAGTGS